MGKYSSECLPYLRLKLTGVSSHQALRGLFGIADQQTCICFRCNYTWTRGYPWQWDHWWTIMCDCNNIPFGVPPPGSAPFTVRQLLDRPYVAPGMIDRDCSVRCPSCGHGQYEEKRPRWQGGPQTLNPGQFNRSVWALEAAPAILFIEFLLVEHDPVLGRRVREWPIDIPDTLDMSTYQSNRLRRVNPTLRYTLQGVIYINVSQNVLPGNQHFTMAVKNPRGVFYVDDQHVQQWTDRTRLRRSTQVIGPNQQDLVPGTWRPSMLMFTRDD